VKLSWTGTAALAVTGLAAAISPTAPLLVVESAVAVVLFAAGCVLFAWGYGRAVSRSRRDAVHLAGLVMLSGVAPEPVRRALLGSVGAQCAIAVVVAAVRPAAAAAVLAPVYGVGACALWGATHGRFRRRARN
jgi:hypothetical protein